MNCLGCYKKSDKPFCLQCRKALFDGLNVPSELPFDAPKSDNFFEFQKHTKQLSISGVQLKYSLKLHDGELSLTENNGKFILKPVPPARQLIALEDVPENEHLTMHIAARVFKIKTAANTLIYFKDGNPAYITRRFDVHSDDSKYRQEDFAQLLNRTSETHGQTYKYDGSYEEIGLLIKKYVAAAPPALERFFQLVVFNYVFSNGDAHLKNFSLLAGDSGEYQLAPAYDLMSTILHTPLEADTALDLYYKSMEAPFYAQYGYYGRSDFMELSKRLGLVEKRAMKIIDNFIDKKEEVKAFINNSLLSAKSKEIYSGNFEERIKRILVQ